jgi:hypothetical protein
VEDPSKGIFAAGPDGSRFRGVKTLAILATAGAAAAATLHVSLAVQTLKPKAGAHWPYKVTATRGGKPAKGTVTAQIVDPLGGVHAV